MTFNPKGVFFWLFLAGMAVCFAFAWGPLAGALAFSVLALGIQLAG